MTIVTSSYHQRRGQTLYHLLAELYRREHGYSAESVGNYCLDIEPSSPALARDGRIAVRQMGEILGLPEEVLASLPSMRPPQPPEEGGEDTPGSAGTERAVLPSPGND